MKSIPLPKFTAVCVISKCRFILYTFQLTGTPILGYKRLQFNIILHKVSKFTPMNDLRAMIFPIFWVDEVRFTNIYLPITDLLIWLLPGRGKGFFSTPQFPNRLWAHQAM
jgi:hypothetical protein